jgi:hypothetical protein
MVQSPCDRPWIAIDHTAGPNRGRLYCASNIGKPYLITSSDGGRTFQVPAVPQTPRGAVYPAQPVILSNGSLLAAFRWFPHQGFASDTEYIRTFWSNDGGRTETTGALVTNWRHSTLTPHFRTTQGPTFPQLAIDPGSPSCADQLCIVWAQRFANRPTTEWFLCSSSTDRGRTWSAPVNLSEQPDPADSAHDYIAYLPCIAVNKAGVVAVTWYDRRGLPSAANEGSMKGWNIRMRVSRDGGRTWSPSVQVTSKASTGQLTGGHTAGICADASGNFHAAWIDDRTGKPQLWTARITVK